MSGIYFIILSDNVWVYMRVSVTISLGGNLAGLPEKHFHYAENLSQ